MRISDTLARLAAQVPQAGWPNGANDRLDDLPSGFSNPGALRARMYVPADLAPGAPLVVLLHGCTQTAAGYDAGTGWSRLADRAGFALLLPEQQRANNANLCFNWFAASDIARRGGEAESIAGMVAAMVEQHRLDRDRVFVTGLSAGGAMTAVMLAAYPDVFAGGAIIGGLPYGSADGVAAALQRMRGQDDKDARQLVTAAAGASRLASPRWPTVSLWHGSADMTVVPSNMDDLAAQWRGVHGVGNARAVCETGPHWSRQHWDVAGRTVVETWLVQGMGHGVPIDPSQGLGTAGPYFLPVGIDSTVMIARSWGIAPSKVAAVRPRPAPSDGQRPSPNAERMDIDRRSPTGVQKVIEDALRVAGLMK